MATNPTNRRANQAVYLDGGVISSAPAGVTSLLVSGQLGSVFIKDGIAYQLVKNSSTTACVANEPVMWSDFDDFTVTPVVSEAKRNYPAGICIGALATLTYGWIQVDGPVAAAIQDGLSTVAGDVLVMSATDGQLTKITAGTAPTYIPFAEATASATVTSSTLAAGTVACNVVVPHNSW